MNVIMLDGNEVRLCENRMEILQNPDMKILEECDDNLLKDKMAYWKNVMHPQKNPSCHLRYERKGIKVYDYEYE